MTEYRRKFKRTLRRMWKQTNATRLDRLASRQVLATTLAKYAEHGQVAVVYGGVDCDGGRWDNRVDILPAQVMAVVRWADDYYDNAEGPQWHHYARPSEVADLKPSSRDLALEAFEDGHPHVIHLGGPGRQNE